MKSKLKKITYLVIGLLIAFLPTNTLIFNEGAQTELSSPKQSAGYSESYIYINGTATGIDAHNWTWAAGEDWCSGDGSWSTPYIIENVSINAISSPTGSGIYINNSLEAYFIIRNCTVYNAGSSINDAGIRLQNTCNGTIIDNNCTNNGNNGISLYSSSNNNTLSGNTANNNSLHGIYLYYDCDFNNIINNTVNDNTDQGIYLETDCDKNNIKDNIINDNTLHGIYLDYNCDFNNIVNNTANHNTGHGIYLSNSDYSNITDNTINDNNLHGIHLLMFDHSNITDNTINNNNLHGIYLNDCEFNNITDNTINDNTGHGIYLQSGCNNNNITKNTINDNTNTGIYLISSCDNNGIKNNTINRNDVGIVLYQCDNNNISGNTLIDNSFCIYEYSSSDNVIEYNDCSPPTVQEPININDAATGVGANNWTWAKTESLCSGSGTWNDPYIIENLKICGFSEFNGIEIKNSNVSFIIQDCLIYNSKTGIYLDTVNNSLLINNNCSNINWGIQLDYSNNNTISGNTANGNNYEGIYLTECIGNILSGNTANDNEDYGIHLQTKCVNNALSGNTVNNNGDSGIFIEEDGNNNTISGNTANDNGDYGIYLYDLCSNNTISGNILSDNNYGMYIESDNNIIYENFFLKNGIHAVDDGTDNKWNSTTIGNYWDNWTSPDVSPNDGIVDDPYTYIGGSTGSIDYSPIAEDGAPSITINSPTSSDVFAVTAPSFDVIITDIYVDSMWYTIDGGINNYTFLENGIINQTAWAAKTQGSVTITFYASDIISNIGIAEVSVAKDITAPIIVINSPTDGAEFGTQAPLFNITVTDDHLDSIWYSFDGGVTTFAITNNTVFNQTAWTALPEGDVTITFYANDTLGHEASEAVTVVKIISAGGLDPGIIITIIVVSISGGVAVAAVIFIYLKKRASPK